MGDKSDNMAGATNTPTDCTAHHQNNATDTHTGVGVVQQPDLSTTFTAAMPDISEVISRELSIKLSGNTLSLINVIGKVIHSQFEAYLTKLDKQNNVKDENKCSPGIKNTYSRK